MRHGVACITCRRRGRKCDKTHPACNACISRGRLCEGYLLRWLNTLPTKLSAKHQPQPVLSRAREPRRVFPSNEPFVVNDGSMPGKSTISTSDDANSGDVPLVEAWQRQSAVTKVEKFSPADVDSAAAVALLTDSTKCYEIDPCSVPDGLGHLVNYGMWTNHLSVQYFPDSTTDTPFRSSRIGFPILSGF